jgi:CheY-like chemotaxis protein
MQRIRLKILKVNEENCYLIKFAKKKQMKPDHSKLTFLKAISHNLRNPLNEILGATEYALENLQMESEIRETFSKIMGGTKMLSMKAEDLLDYANILSNEFKANKTYFNRCEFLKDFEELVTAQKAIIKGNNPDSSVDFQVNVAENVPKRIFTDKQRLCRALLHLILNSIKFTYKGSITLCVSYSVSTQDLTFEVRDTGIGIDDNKRKLLETFLNGDETCLEQTDSKNELTEIGFGLLISAKICERIGSKLQLSTLENCGTQFTFSVKQTMVAPSTMMLFKSRKINKDNQNLRKSQKRFSILHGNPCERRLTSVSEDIGSSEEQIPNEHSGNETINVFCNKAPSLIVRHSQGNVRGLLKICSSSIMMKSAETNRDLMFPISALVVDDIYLNRFVLVQQLNKRGIRTVEAENGSQALNYTRIRFFDFIFMDIDMPVMDGVTATGLIRKDENEQGKVPSIIVAVTAFENSQTAEACLKAGVNQILIKPVTSVDIYGIIKKHYQTKD